MNARASVIICAYKYVRFVPRCLESVRPPSRPANEINVVEEARRTKCKDVVVSFLSVRNVRQKTAGRPQRSIEDFRPRGTVLCHLDVADFWLSNNLESVSDILESITVGGMTHCALCVEESLLLKICDSSQRVNP